MNTSTDSQRHKQKRYTHSETKALPDTYRWKETHATHALRDMHLYTKTQAHKHTDKAKCKCQKTEMDTQTG